MTTLDPAPVRDADPGPDPETATLVPPVRERRSVLVALSFVWLAVVILAALLADVISIAPYDSAVGSPRLSPSFGAPELLLGTDQLGRSLLVRCIHGAQVSLVVGAVAGLLGATIGGTLGMAAGYLGGRVDAVIRLLADAMLAFPPLILLLALAAVLTPSVPTILLGLTLLVIPTFIRLARANTLAWASREFVMAARNMGSSRLRILFREIMPNLLPSIAAFLPVVMAALIVAEGSLSFLGMGIPPPTPSWGGMISDGKDSIDEYPHLVFVPALVIFFTVFSLNQAGDHLRLRFDRTMRD